jgi:hypothetical protein
MSDHSYPKYEAFPLKDGGGWYIVVTPEKHGPSYEVHGLASETEARDWIEDLREEYHAARRFRCGLDGPKPRPKVVSA